MNSKDLDKKLAKWEAKTKTCIKWIAVDANGDVWGYDKKPKVDGFLDDWWSCGEFNGYLGTTEDEDLRKNWNKTLRRVNYEQ